MAFARRRGRDRRQGRSFPRRAIQGIERHRARARNRCVRRRARQVRLRVFGLALTRGLQPPFACRRAAESGGAIRIKGVKGAALAMIAIGGISLAVKVQDHQHAMTGTASDQTDSRQLVKFPQPMRLHTITSTSDHLLALQEIDFALSQNAFDKAATIAEHRLGMSSLELLGAAHIAPFMPKGMQDIGTQMHRAASRFAVDAQTASVSYDVRQALANITEAQVRTMLSHLAEEMRYYDPADLKDFPSTILDRVELEPEEASLRLCYRIPLRSGNKVASPGGCVAIPSLPMSGRADSPNADFRPHVAIVRSRAAQLSQTRTTACWLREHRHS
jgi:hypothetical protein